jgi:hypothetical protein
MLAGPDAWLLPTPEMHAASISDRRRQTSCASGVLSGFGTRQSGAAAEQLHRT